MYIFWFVMWVCNSPEFPDVEHIKLNAAIYLGKKIFQRKTGSSVTFTFELILGELIE
jgi:hypothetical protein